LLPPAGTAQTAIGVYVDLSGGIANNPLNDIENIWVHDVVTRGTIKIDCFEILPYMHRNLFDNVMPVQRVIGTHTWVSQTLDTSCIAVVYGFNV
jgi:hypothetical protein